MTFFTIMFALHPTAMTGKTENIDATTCTAGVLLNLPHTAPSRTSGTHRALQ